MGAALRTARPPAQPDCCAGSCGRYCGRATRTTCVCLVFPHWPLLFDLATITSSLPAFRNEGPSMSPPQAPAVPTADAEHEGRRRAAAAVRLPLPSAVLPGLWIRRSLTRHTQRAAPAARSPPVRRGQPALARHVQRRWRPRPPTRAPACPPRPAAAAANACRCVWAAISGTAAPGPAKGPLVLLDCKKL